MEDRVLKGFVETFAEKRALTHSEPHEVFEAFSTSSILRKYHQADLEDDLLTGGAGDGGIDAIAILVNGRTVRARSDVDFFIDNLGRLEVDFVFVQAKRSAAFDASEIGTFTYGVQQFFSDSPNLEFNDDVRPYIDLMNYIFSKSINMQESPKCHLYYVTSGVWKAPAEPTARLESGKEELEQTRLFSEVRATPVDGGHLKVIYREVERGVVREIELSKSTVFPRIDGVDQAYIGLLPGPEFIKLVSTDDGQLNSGLFYDNVRDFQGNNPVNAEIKQTINDVRSSTNFPLLNNGITIVARAVNRTGDVFRISDFQIVNGCQTTHILFQNKSKVRDDVYIPVKLVATGDSEIVTDVIKATNRQTAVLPEALESLSSFHRELEDFYNTQERNVQVAYRVYYERRSKQYALDNVDQKNIITLARQTKAFVAMFLNEPHSHIRYYGELLKSYEGRLFAYDHRPAPYYASGIALLKVEEFINSALGHRWLRQYKYHMLMLIRILLSGGKAPRFSANAITSYALDMVESLRDETRCNEVCIEAAECIAGALESFVRETNVAPNRLRTFTKLVADVLLGREGAREDGGDGQEKEVAREERGRIKWYDGWRRYGFILRENGDDLFVHESALVAVPWHLRTQNTEVIFTREADPRRPEPGWYVAVRVRVSNNDSVDV